MRISKNNVCPGQTEKRPSVVRLDILHLIEVTITGSREYPMDPLHRTEVGESPPKKPTCKNAILLDTQTSTSSAHGACSWRYRSRL